MGETKAQLATEVERLRARVAELEERAESGELGLLRAFVAALPDVAFVFDGDGRYLEVVTRQQGLLMTAPDDILGKLLSDVMPPEIAEPAMDLLRLAIDTGEPQQLEYHLDVPAGARWFEARLARMDSANGIERVACVVRDITDRKQVDEALRQSEARMFAVIESLPFEFYAMGKDGRYVMQNSHCRRVWGDVVGLRPEELAPNEEIGAVWAENTRRALVGESITDEREMVVNGVRRVFLSVMAPIRHLREVEGLVGLRMDVTNQRAFTDRWVKVQKLESLGLLASGIAHDFNNLLMAVVGHISLSRMQHQAGATADALLDEAERACLRAQALTQQLMTFARGGEPMREVVGLRDLLRESARFATSGSNCRYELAVPNDLWPAFVDLGQIHQVVNALILNAVQAMPQGGTVELVAENVANGAQHGLDAGRYVRFVVADTGVGISSEHLTKVFDPYFTTAPDGRGLGLAVAHSIVNHHGGRIEIESREGRGSAVVVHLPAAEEEALPETAPAGPAARGSGRILVMDDELALLNLTTIMLESLGYSADAAASCDEAVVLFETAVAEGRPFRAAILDLTVPGGPGGVACAERLRAIDASVPAIVSSGYSNDPVLAEHHSHGFAGVLPKPFSREELGEVLQQVLRPTD